MVVSEILGMCFSLKLYLRHGAFARPIVFAICSHALATQLQTLARSIDAELPVDTLAEDYHLYTTAAGERSVHNFRPIPLGILFRVS